MELDFLNTKVQKAQKTVLPTLPLGDNLGINIYWIAFNQTEQAIEVILLAIN